MIRQNRFLEQRKNTVECTVMDTCRYMFVQTQSPAEKLLLSFITKCLTHREAKEGLHSHTPKK